MRQPALAIWIVSGGKKVINAHAVVRLMIRFVFRLVHQIINSSVIEASKAFQPGF